MDAIQHLLKDHEEVGKLFNQFVVAGEQAYKQKQDIAEKVTEEITKHVQLEEEILYPAFEERGGEEAEKMALEGIESHNAAKFMMSRLENTKPEDKTFDAKFKVLMEITKHHVMDEEHFVFPMAKTALDEILDSLGEEMDSLEKKMKK